MDALYTQNLLALPVALAEILYEFPLFRSPVLSSVPFQVRTCSRLLS